MVNPMIKYKYRQGRIQGKIYKQNEQEIAEVAKKPRKKVDPCAKCAKKIKSLRINGDNEVVLCINKGTRKEPMVNCAVVGSGERDLGLVQSLLNTLGIEKQF
jgi:hypothetical protein